THLPQVAAVASDQLVVSEAVRDGHTFTAVTRVDGDERIAEGARMLGGAVPGAALDHATELRARWSGRTGRSAGYGDLPSSTPSIRATLTQVNPTRRGTSP